MGTLQADVPLCKQILFALSAVTLNVLNHKWEPGLMNLLFLLFLVSMQYVMLHDLILVCKIPLSSTFFLTLRERTSEI